MAKLSEDDLHSMDLADALAGADLAVIVTAHPGVDPDAAVELVPQALDLRGVTRRSAGVARL